MSDLTALIGQKYNLLTVLSTEKDANNKTRFVCQCDCGTLTKAYKIHLITGHKKSCGCIIYGDHGGKPRIEYDAWRKMIKRCTNETDEAYSRYGGRGITVCERWLNSFDDFLADMGHRPSSNHSIDREDNDKGYSPNNCRWATKEEQNNNRRSNVILHFNGESLTISQWANKLGCSHAKLNNRISKLGWSIEKTLTHNI